MDIFTTLLLLILLSISYYLFLRSKTSSSSSSSPPGPPRLPIIGNLHQLLGKPRHVALWELSKKYGPLMQIFIASKKFLIISSPDLAKQILKTQDHIFCSRDRFHATKRITYNFSDVAFSPHNAHWREMRKIFVSEFIGPKRAKLSRHMMVNEVEAAIRSLSPGKEVNLSKLILEVVKEMVCKVSFGENYRKQPLTNGQSWDAMLCETMELLDGSIGDSFPFLGFFIDHLTGWNRRADNNFKNVNAYIDAIIEDHLKTNTEEISAEDKDFVHTVLDMSSREDGSGYRPNTSDLKALVLDVLTGGIDTTVSTTLWTMSELIKMPRVMHKLQSEIRNSTGKIQKVSEMDTTKSPYLKKVVKETLRRRMAAPLLIPHVSLSHTQIEGYDVLPGTTVLINGRGIASDPNVWGENASEFYPERFETLDGDFGRDRFEMTPFGGGRRSCPAINTVPANVEFIVANLVYWYDWKLPNGMTTEDLNMEENGTLVVGKKVPLCVVPVKHNWEDIA